MYTARLGKHSTRKQSNSGKLLFDSMGGQETLAAGQRTYLGTRQKTTKQNLVMIE